jgi:hypothetical protein
MAKEQREGKARVRLFYAEVEGGDGAIQDGLRSLATALVRAVQPPAVSVREVKSLPPPARNGKGDTVTQPMLFDQEAQGSEQDNESDEEGFIGGNQLIPENARPRESRQKKPASYNFVTDLNLQPEDKPHLREFFKEKNPRDQQEQVAVFLYYLGQMLGLTGINANHLYTCFRDVEKRVPKEILQIVRNTAARKGWVDATDPKNLRITTPGQNFVAHDLPNQASF